ncbi:hypothetical protein [Paenibacillus eucommiae]|uniref:Uncharacterized protein n=1 Tax=Paenibacillus eucommiae TaxID=1355755 RepID=A0ABS4IVZ3_9BACL|nr:hypothetical protein [Paenibacillus eucommiae]MBP1991740.1 hypothetical protein [Paenibacillus eucommiae]
MELRMLKLRETVVVDKIVSFHYNELPKDYVEDVGLDFACRPFRFPLARDTLPVLLSS